MAFGLGTLRNRIRRAGGIRNFLSMWIRSSFRPFWDLLQSIPVLKGYLNQFYLSRLLASLARTVPRMPRHNLNHDFVSMDVLYDEGRTTYSRLLPRNPTYTASLPPAELVSTLFEREEFAPEINRNLSSLIGFYAQWFSHQFFNTNPDKPNFSNMPVGINLSQLYGSTPEIEREQRSFKGGRLKSTIRNDEEFPEILPAGPGVVGEEMFNIPIERANMVPGFAAVHILFFRRHQYVADQLSSWAESQGREMSDEEIYQKAKMILAINVLRLTMHDYVAEALQSSHVHIMFDKDVKRSLMWRLFGPGYFPPCNAIQIEFNLLYRWHQFMPVDTRTLKQLPPASELNKDTIAQLDNDADVDSLVFPPPGTMLGEDWNSVKKIADEPNGLERILYSAASQRAGKLELMNTDKWLVRHAVLPSIEKTRQYKLASYNDYREYFGFGKVTSFDQITTNPAMREKLEKVYGHVDQIEYYPGIFAEDKDFGGVHGPFLATIGVGMTFCGIFASRLFEEVVNEEALTPRGLELANEINYIRDMTRLHTKLNDARMRFTMPESMRIRPNKTG